MLMKCRDALAVMLSAEPGELQPDDLTPLGRHLADCARCRRVAAQLRDDTAHLAAMVAVPRVAVRRAPLRLVPWLAGAAAVTALVVVLRTPPEPDVVIAPPTPSRGIVAAAAPGTPDVEPQLARASGGRDIPVRPRLAALAGTPQPVPEPISPVSVVAVPLDLPEATLAVAFDPPTSVAAVPLHATPTYATVAAMTPNPRELAPPNRDVTVVPSRPGVTALWFN
jgi:hypothetical protein